MALASDGGKADSNHPVGLKRSRMSGASTSNPKGGLSGWVIVAVVGAALFVIAQCSGTPKSDQQVAAASFTSETSKAIASVAPAAVEPLEMTSVRAAAKDFKAVYGAQQLPGAMIFSQNCFEGLAHEFSWSRLDECGAFDAIAVGRLDAEADTTSSEYTYFDQEIAAGRYLAAVSSAGESADNSDLRLEDLHAKVAVAAPAPTPAAMPDQGTEPAPADAAEEGWEASA
ncbi:hypothetical protein [Novosphingobium guangzhouense]|uniref:hypothetical protein n=1 Tax=Novosphingobium guangzhouense TaxID=1850347 RepID=UPI0011AF8A5A|nr:hypothetical protein [Novosphingobium guangzhouense]